MGDHTSLSIHVHCNYYCTYQRWLRGKLSPCCCLIKSTCAANKEWMQIWKRSQNVTVTHFLGGERGGRRVLLYNFAFSCKHQPVFVTETHYKMRTKWNIWSSYAFTIKGRIWSGRVSVAMVRFSTLAVDKKKLFFPCLIPYEPWLTHVIYWASEVSRRRLCSCCVL